MSLVGARLKSLVLFFFLFNLIKLTCAGRMKVYFLLLYLLFMCFVVSGGFLRSDTAKVTWNMKKILTAKQQRFCDEYLIDLNATQAAIRAGYSTKTARSIGAENLTKADIQAYIEKRMAEKEAELIADQDEVLKYLTSVLRGESEGEEIVVEGIGEGYSEARTVKKGPSEKEKLKAAELLGKRYGLYTEKIQAEVMQPVFAGEDELED